jgi:uncharacterized membrane protein YfcA
MFPTETLLIVAATFIVAGFVKGVIGLGLPTVVLALLTASLGLKEAMALMLLPSLATNVWQAFAGKALKPLLRRMASLLALACIFTWIGISLFTRMNTVWLSALLGFVVCVYAILGLTGTHMPSPGRNEKWLSPVIGAANGLLAGLTGSYVMPGTLYLQSLGLTRDELIQAMGILFTVSTVALAIAMQGHGLIPKDLGMLSALALVPAFAGMFFGQWVRGRMTEQRFRKVFYWSLLVLGVYIVGRALIS